MEKRKLDRPTWGWLAYDWASSAFATTVMAGFFPIFFKQYWNEGIDVTISTFRLGTANSIASLTVALMAPILGAIADAGARRKHFLLVFAAIGAMLTATLYFVSQGAWFVAAVVYVAAILGFSGSNVFYDALLVTVASREKTDSVSALGFAIGYLGGGILFAINVAMTLFPGAFGLADAGAAVRVSFITVAVWWGVFSIPLAMYVREAPARRSRSSSVTEGFAELLNTFRQLRQHKTAFQFLVAYWLYIDGVHTIVRMAVDYGLSLGFTSNDLIAALLIVQFVGFPSSIAFGRFAGAVGSRRAILAGVVIYMGISLWGVRMSSIGEFYALAVCIGLVQGGVTSLSRSYFSGLIPREKAGQFFGFYNTVGRFSAVLGPVLMGWVSVATGNPRYSMFAVLALFVVGGAILLRARDEAK